MTEEQIEYLTENMNAVNSPNFNIANVGRNGAACLVPRLILKI